MPYVLLLLALILPLPEATGPNPVLRFAPAYAPAPDEDLTGIWVGKLYQDAGGIAEQFEFSVQIRQVGPAIKGTTFVQLDDIWAEMAFSGYRQPNGSWKLTEYEVIRAQKPAALSWCMKRLELVLNYTDEGMVLTGPWWGNSEFGPCVPGSVRLHRKANRV